MAGVPESGCMGCRLRVVDGSLHADGRHVDRRRRHAARDHRVTLNTDVRTSGAIRCPTCTLTITNNDIAMRNHAYGQGEKIYQARGAVKTFRTPPYPSTHNLGHVPDECQGKRRRVQQVRPDARHPQPFHLGRQSVSPPAARKIQRSPLSRWRSVRRSHRNANEPEDDLNRRTALTSKRSLLEQEARMCQFYVKADPILYESRSRTIRIHGVITSIRLENLAWMYSRRWPPKKAARPIA